MISYPQRQKSQTPWLHLFQFLLNIKFNELTYFSHSKFKNHCIVGSPLHCYWMCYWVQSRNRSSHFHVCDHQFKYDTCLLNTSLKGRWTRFNGIVTKFLFCGSDTSAFFVINMSALYVRIVIVDDLETERWQGASNSCNWDKSLIARFMGPTWGPPGADRTQVGPMLAPWTLLSGVLITSNTVHINSSPPWQNGRHFAEDIFKCIFMNEKCCILIKIRRQAIIWPSADSLMHICGTRERWVNSLVSERYGCYYKSDVTLRWMPRDLTDDQSTLV